ncbi:LysR family transcriptional regulator [Erwinia sp. S63]|uniref:LysR family transcriptional regulator n=1 Tax=Erwinia sp. S63 TaxID=2769341 RepID=UPI00190D8DD4|nr:LysR family transcriptional regulator [Erwinia sp. S63]MBK0095538.1 LysR family transcriptional regulator [Erwinia sp. S63]
MKIENISDLRVVVHTAQTGSLTGAAQILNMTPAGASAALKRIETQLSVRLFERSTRVMKLTDSGRKLIDYATRAFDLLEEGEAQISAGQETLIGKIRLAAPSDLTRNVLLPWLDEFLESHPSVQLQLHVGDRALDVVRDEVDLAIRYGELHDSGLVSRRLAIPKTILCASPRYLAKKGTPTHPRELEDHNCLTFMRGGQRHSLWHFQKDGLKVAIRVAGNRSADDASLARDWATAGHGILLKTRLELEKELSSNMLVPLMPDWETETYPLHALLPSGRFVPNRVRTLMEFLISKLDSNLPFAQ